MLPGRAADYSTAPPQTRTSGFPASGSSEQRIRHMNVPHTPSRVRSIMLSALSACLGSEVQSPRPDASTAVPRSGASLSYSQAPVGSSYPAFNRYYEGAKTSLAHPTGFGVTSPDGTTCGPPLCLHRVARGQPRDLENFASGPRPCSCIALWRLRDLPSSQGTPVRICPALRPRSDPDARPISRRPDAAPAQLKTKAHNEEFISGLNHTAFAPAVYASCRGCPTTTQDSLPAGGQPLPDGIDYPLGSDERFQINCHPPFLSLAWRNNCRI